MIVKNFLLKLWFLLQFNKSSRIHSSNPLTSLNILILIFSSGISITCSWHIIYFYSRTNSKYFLSLVFFLLHFTAYAHQGESERDKKRTKKKNACVIYITQHNVFTINLILIYCCVNVAYMFIHFSLSLETLCVWWQCTYIW